MKNQGVQIHSPVNIHFSLASNAGWWEFGLVNWTGAKVRNLGIFPKSTTHRVFKTDIGEFTDFHPSEKLDQNQFLEVTLQNKVKIFNGKSKNFIKKDL